MHASQHASTTHRGLTAFILLTAVAASAFVVDVVTKLLALRWLSPGEPVALIGDLLSLTLVFNPGAAFSFAGGVTWVFSLIAIAVVLAIIWYARRLRSFGWALALGLLLGGTLGNLADRLLPKDGAPSGRAWGQGVVVDFIQVKYFAIFNMADVFISLAVVVFLFLVIRGIGLDGTITRGTQPVADTEIPDPVTTTAALEVDSDSSRDGIVDDRREAPAVVEPRALADAGGAAEPASADDDSSVPER